MVSTSRSKRSFCDQLLYGLEEGDLQAPLQKANVQLTLYYYQTIILTVVILRQNRFCKCLLISTLTMKFCLAVRNKEN